MARKLKPIQLVRRIILGALLLAVTVLAVLHQRLQGIPTIDAIDPFGGLETLFSFMAGGTILKRIEPGSIILFGGLVALGIVLSRFFCGWFCAFGALQGLFGWLGKKIFRRRFAIPQKLDSILRYAKYPILVAILYFTWKTGELVIRPYDPFAAYGHLSAGIATVWSEFTVGFVLLIAIILLSIFYDRVFCKYLCPLGAILAILSRIPLFRIRRSATTCISCSRCDRTCPMNVDVSRPESVNSVECIVCMECITVCPTKKNSLSAVFAGRAWKLPVVVAAGLTIYAGAAIAGQFTGMLQFSAPSLQELSTLGSLKVEDIKGSSTYASVAASFGIDLDRLYREVGVDQMKVPPDSMLKDTGRLAGVNGFEPDAVRFAVAKIIGVPYAGESATSNNATSPAASPVSHADAGPKLPSEFSLEGTMSIQDVATALSTSAEKVIERLGLPADIPRDTPLRDMWENYGYTMPSLKEKIAR